MRNMRIRPFGPLVALALLGMPAVAGAALDTGPPVAPPSASGSWSATLVAPIQAFRAPRSGARALVEVAPAGEIGRGETAYLVTGVSGGRWVRLLLPRRPNGLQGWVRRGEVELHRTTARIAIDTGARRLTLFRGRGAVLTTRIAVGRRETPTPRGRHAIAETIRTNDPGSFFGPLVLPLTAHSETIQEFNGGKGRVAIHGTSLPRLLGTAASLGCIRMSNATVTTLARIARPGTPVIVT